MLLIWHLLGSAPLFLLEKICILLLLVQNQCHTGNDKHDNDESLDQLIR